MEKRSKSKLWIIVFITSFLGLMVDAMDLQMLSLSLPQLMKEFNMSEVQAGTLGTSSLAGMAIGGMIGGWMADRFGRVRTISWTIILFSVGTALLVLAGSYEQFIVIRFISSLGLGAEYVVVNMLMAEYIPSNKRTTVLGTVQAGWSVGYLVATLLSGAILPEFGWRPLFLIALVPVLIAIYTRFVIPEPEGWKEIVRERSEVKKNEWIQVLSKPKLRLNFLLWTVTALFLQFGYYGVNSWLPTYLVNEVGYDFKNMTGYLVGTYTAMILGKILTGRLADIFGRRTMFVIGGLSTAIALPLIIHFQSPGNIVVLLTVFGFLYGMPYAVNATYMSESFPTHVRGTAVGGAYNIGRAGAAFAPVVIGMIATQQSIGLGLASLGIAYALCGIIPALFIREKMYEPFEKKAPQDSEQGQLNSGI
ncbi:MFS transporter [Weizmannia acidilactici]|uniref:MFS transporter n=1 Tax=Weizmannia acidilactici TaxID=2607726 RepID=A0A5J4JJ07_9BACI|nr:MFS transporter [Weizmannia acidilactici]GER67424.1 MFS transporter [Weizmannia acidilactici]GER70520.1 MFS transporter [Weizmannia acidilactici]GER72578.1 MFS transporter [Weizmannia acidilactici]